MGQTRIAGHSVNCTHTRYRQTDAQTQAKYKIQSIKYHDQNTTTIQHKEYSSINTTCKIQHTTNNIPQTTYHKQQTRDNIQKQQTKTTS